MKVSKEGNMDASIQGSLNKLNKVWQFFEHKGKPMSKNQVKKVLEFGKSKGFQAVSQISDTDIETILSKES